MDFQQIWQQIQSQIQSSMAQAATPPSLQTPDLVALFKGASAKTLARVAKIQMQYLKEAQALSLKGLNPTAMGAAEPPPVTDKRFASDAWTKNPVFSQLAQQYLLNSRTLVALADCVEGDVKTKARVRFAVGQAIDAASPANSMALNPEAQALAIESKGQSVAAGLKNLFADAKQGHMSQTDESLFEVGRNVATTPGAVVFENAFFQLIEYQPTTPQVFALPFLIIPPCINKFYILDLQPANSFVAHAVAQGHRTFVLSWRNPDASLAQATFDDYIEHAAIEAINVTRKLTNAPQINALGFCVGGTILGTAMAVLAARAESNQRKSALPEVASATFLTTLLDFSDTGVLDLFIDESFVKYREDQLNKPGVGGLLKGRELASTFSFLRPNELVWNYVQGNYLKGKTPPPFDLLYWNSDSTNLPGPMYCWYLRNTYLANKLCEPGQTTVCGSPVDLGKITQPAYVYGSREDHIVPIGGAYASLQHLGGPTRFVMGASGHIAGVINPPAANKRSHWLAPTPSNDKLSRGKRSKAAASGPTAHPATHAEWLETATERAGSWWPDWAAWLAGHGGEMRSAPTTYAAPAIEPAPGRYVAAKAT